MSKDGTGTAVILTAGLLAMALFGVWHVFGTLAIMLGAAMLANTIINDS
jgi:hypothetical protein